MCHSNFVMCPTRRSFPRKTCKFRLSRNSTKIDVVARFRERIPTVKSFHHPRSRKILNFYRNYDFALFEKNWIFSGFYILPSLKIYFTHTHPTTCICNLTQLKDRVGYDNPAKVPITDNPMAINSSMSRIQIIPIIFIKKNFILENFIFKNFISFYLILFYFFKKSREQCFMNSVQTVTHKQCTESQYTAPCCNTISSATQASFSVTIHSVYCDPIP